jgi:hypothetical protein
MDLGKVFHDYVGTAEVDVFFAGDGGVCFRCSSRPFFGLEGGGEVEWVDCCWGCRWI